jgi:UDP-glucose 4-epimerase
LKRVIITGGTGFIGRHLVKKLASYKPVSVALISNSSKPNHLEDTELPEAIPLTYYTADIRDEKAISDIFDNEKADTCVHLAAKISVADSIRKPDETMQINANGTLNVLEACHKSGINNFVFASSAAVYGDVKELPITENQMLRPLSPYGSSKMLAEQFVSSYQRQNRIKNATSLRIFNVYGDGQAGESDVITRFAKRLSSGQPPAIYGNGMQTRDFISVDDVVDAILLSIRSMEVVDNKESTLSSVFNVGTGTPTSVTQLAQKMIAIFGLNLQPIYENGEEGESGILHSFADMTKAREILHFVPKKGIEAGLKEMIRAMLIRKRS